MADWKEQPTKMLAKKAEHEALKSIEIKTLTDEDLQTMAKTVVWSQPLTTKTDIEYRLLMLLRRLVILTREEQAVVRKALDCAMKARLHDADREASFDLTQLSVMRVRLREKPGKETPVNNSPAAEIDESTQLFGSQVSIAAVDKICGKEKSK